MTDKHDEVEATEADEQPSEVEADPTWEVLTERQDGHRTVHRVQAPDHATAVGLATEQAGSGRPADLVLDVQQI